MSHIEKDPQAKSGLIMGPLSRVAQDCPSAQAMPWPPNRPLPRQRVQTTPPHATATRPSWDFPPPADFLSGELLAS
jgi:hypothetical protein